MKFNKIIITIILFALALAGCSSSDEGKSSSDTKRNNNTRRYADEDTTTTRKSAKSNEIEEFAVNKNIFDPTMKYDININRYLVNVPFDSTLDPDIGEGKINVFVELTATNNSDYISLIGTPDFKLETSDGELVINCCDGRVLEYIAKENITTLSNDLISREETKTRWLVFEVPEELIEDSLTLIYNREEGKTYSDEIIPGYTTEIILQ